jgi:hypothetical protein
VQAQGVTPFCCNRRLCFYIKVNLPLPYFLSFNKNNDKKREPRGLPFAATPMKLRRAKGSPVSLFLSFNKNKDKKGKQRAQGIRGVAEVRGVQPGEKKK